MNEQTIYILAIATTFIIAAFLYLLDRIATLKRDFHKEQVYTRNQLADVYNNIMQHPPLGPFVASDLHNRITALEKK